MATNEIQSGYFWEVKTNSLAKRLGIKSAPKEESWIKQMFSKQKTESEKPSTLEKVWGFLTWVKETVEEPLFEIQEWVINIAKDVESIAKWDIKNAPWLIWDFARSTRKGADRIQKLNAAIDETWGNFWDKAVWFWLNIFWEIVDFWWDVIMAGIKTLAPESLEVATEEKVKEFASSEFWQDVIGFAKEAGTKWEQFKQSSPEANRFGLSVESVLPVAEIYTWGLIGKATKDVAWELLETWIKKGWDLLTSGKEIVWESIDSVKEWVSNLTLPDLPKLWNNPSKIAENIAWIDDQTKNILKESTTEDFNKYVQAWKDAAENIKNPSPMDIAGQEVWDVLLDITNRKKEAGKRMWEIVKSNPDVRINTWELLTNYQTFLRDRFNLEVDGNTLKVSPIKWKESKTSDINLIETLNNDILSIVTKEDIWIEDLEAISSRIKSNFSKLLSDRWVGSSLSADEKSLKWFIGWEITGMIKKNLPEEYSTASADFARLIDMEDRLNKLLWDSWDKWASFIKSAYSPQTWSRFRRLAEDIKEETGIDITTKAGLAKFAMQLAWDPRQASLLEALDLWTWFTSKLTSKLQKIPFIWDLAELWEIWAKKLFPTEKVGRWLTQD